VGSQYGLTSGAAPSRQVAGVSYTVPVGRVRQADGAGKVVPTGK